MYNSEGLRVETIILRISLCTFKEFKDDLSCFYGISTRKCLRNPPSMTNFLLEASERNRPLLLYNLIQAFLRLIKRHSNEVSTDFSRYFMGYTNLSSTSPNHPLRIELCPRISPFRHLYTSTVGFKRSLEIYKNICFYMIPSRVENLPKYLKG